MVFTVFRKRINVCGKQYKNQIANVRRKKDIGGLVHLGASPILCMEKLLPEALRQQMNDLLASMINSRKRQLVHVLERKGG